MAKKDEDKLRHELSLHRAMQLSRYRDPVPLDMKAALDASTETSRFGGKKAHGYFIVGGKPVIGWFSKTSNEHGLPDPVVFSDPTHALIHHRNTLAHKAAERLLALDAQIEQHVTGSGLSLITHGDVEVFGADMRQDGVVMKPFEPQASIRPAVDVKPTGALVLAGIQDKTVKAMVLALMKKRGYDIDSDTDVKAAMEVVRCADETVKAELKKLADDEWIDAAGNDPTSTDKAVEERKDAEDEAVEQQAAKAPRKRSTGRNPSVVKKATTKKGKA